ncbi:MAG: hypothetical protein IJ721_02800 [Bacteroidales bacterium]|nr:hypothetical protein [Bacteroidales bacterium]
MRKACLAPLLAGLSVAACAPKARPDLVVPKGTPSGWMEIGCVNWAEEFPAHPDVHFRVWHDGDFFYIEYKVREELTKAEQDVPGGFVHLDSCVECFLHPDPENSPWYYSLEWNAAGHMFLARRTGRDNPEVAPLAVIESVRTEPSLGHEPFGPVALDGPWTLKVAIPASALFKDGLRTWDGFTCRMNFYKCTQGVENKDFLSWSPVHTPKPSFHNPETFRSVEFEK